MGKVVTGPVAFLVSGLIDVALLIAYLVRRSWAALVVVAVLGVALSSPAGRAEASTTQASIIMDDDALIYASPATVEANLKKIAALGINTVKVSVVWSLVAPDPNSTTAPSFNATDPSAYPAINWDRYDTVVEDAQALGLNVYFQLTAPAPRWATDARNLPARGYVTSNDVNAQEFAEFVAAVGRRYSGGYVPPPVPTDTGGSQTVTTPLGTYTAPTEPAPVSQTSGDYTTIPAVHEWGIWNEPNEVGWLSPVTHKVAGRTVAASPVTERALTNLGYESLLATGHANDTILIGETASGGDIRTIPFVEDLYCVNARNQPLRGSTASALGCPTSGSRAQFVEANPGLFAATGYAHHPYSFNIAPSQREKDKGDVTIANISVLENAIDAIFRTYGEPSGLPLYLTEFGYKTNPPNPTVTTTLGQQEVWLDQADYLTYEMPRVKALAQELLFDELPDSTYPKGSSKYWATYDSGLFYHDGTAKPSFAAYRLPIWLPSQRTGSRVAVWAQIRPGPHYVTEHATLQFAPTGAKRWTTLAAVSTKNLEGYLVTHVAISQKGRLRLAWTDPLGSGTYYSRTVPIS